MNLHGKWARTDIYNFKEIETKSHFTTLYPLAYPLKNSTFESIKLSFGTLFLNILTLYINIYNAFVIV